MLDPELHSLAYSLFPRLLGVIYFFAIGSLIFQIQGLIGKNGILPLPHYLDLIDKRFHKKKYLYVPTLFWFNSSNYAILGLTSLGVLLSIGLMLGLYPPLMLFLLYIVFLSIVSAGQDFFSYVWDVFILEITIYAFLMSLTPIPNLAIWIGLNFLLFRFSLETGAVKWLSNDQTWWNLTATAYHYQTQPLPNTIAWYAYKMPLNFQKLSTLVVFIIEIICPFGIFFNEQIRLGVFVVFFLLQFLIWMTGNFAYLNHLTVVLSIILISDNFFPEIFVRSQLMETTPQPLNILLFVLGSFLILLQLIRLSEHFFRIQFLKRLLNWLSPFYIANKYGLFAVMTTVRYEVVVEGSDDEKEWKEYIFKNKPIELSHRPKRIAPFHPRLDWQFWFLPFSNYSSELWFENFLTHLLTGTPDVLNLLRKNPFENKPPKYIRSLIYQYEFTNFQEKREKGLWWKRKLIGYYSPEMALNLYP